MSSNSEPDSHTVVLPVRPIGHGIPKTIYQVFATKDLPPVIQQNIDKIRNLNPGWEYRLFDDKEMIEFIRESYGTAMLGYYLRINPKYGAARADLFRYLLMYKNGGVYLDVKSSIERPLDEVLDKEDVYLLSRWSSGKGETFEGWGKHVQLKGVGGQEFQQWHIIAAQGHPFLRAVIEQVLRNIDAYNPLLNDTGKDGVLGTTGPIAYTLAITPLLAKHPHRIVDGRESLGLVYSIFGAVTFRAHKSIFRFHYTELQEPVIRLTGARKLIWAMLGPVHIHLVKRLAGFMQASKRHLRRLALLVG